MTDQYSFNGLTGTGTGDANPAIDGIPTALIATGAKAFGFDGNNYFRAYRYDPSETSAETVPRVIIPNDNVSGSGAWVQSAIITPASEYYFIADSTVTDHGVTTTEGNRSVADFVSTIGSSNVATILLRHVGLSASTVYTFTTAVTTTINTSIVVQNGAVIAGAGGLTVASPENIISGSRQQIVSTGTQAVSFSTSGSIRVDWYGRDAAAVNDAYTVCIDGSELLMSGGIWDFGTSRAELYTNKSVTLKGIGGTGYPNVGGTYDAGDGTWITHTGTGAAVKIDSRVNVRDININGGAYGIDIGAPDDGGGSWWGKLDTMIITGASVAGILLRQSQGGRIENIRTEFNAGSGMATAGTSNTLTTCIGCDFKDNGLQGVLAETGPIGDITFSACRFEGNGKEGFRLNGVSSSNVTFTDGSYFETNASDLSTGIYDIYYNPTGVPSANANWLTVENVKFAGITGAGNNFHLFSGGNTVIKPCDWSLIGGNPGMVRLGGSGETYKIYDSLLLQLSTAGGNLPLIAVDDTDGLFTNATGRPWVIVPADGTSFDVWKIHGPSTWITALHTQDTNANLPDNADGYGPYTFVRSAAFQVALHPDGTDNIAPIATAGGNRIANNGNVGDNITITGSIYASLQWIITATQGTWADIGA